MNQSDRQQAIAEYLRVVGACSYPNLAKRFDVSEMTIRRDIESLAGRGVVIKVLGGTQTAHAPKQQYESAFEQRLSTNITQKQQIAHEALKRIQPNQTVFLDGSTTCLVLARTIARASHGLTLVTNSVPVCLELARSTDNAILGLGGQFDSHSSSFVGARTEEEVRQLYIDVFFLSTKGFLVSEGTFESSPATFRLKQIVAGQSAKVILLADYSKFGQRALCKVLDVSEIDEVITDGPISAEDASLVRQSGLSMTVITQEAGAPAHAT